MTTRKERGRAIEAEIELATKMAKVLGASGVRPEGPKTWEDLNTDMCDLIEGISACDAVLIKHVAEIEDRLAKLEDKS